MAVHLVLSQTVEGSSPSLGTTSNKENDMFGANHLGDLLESINRISRALERMADAAEEMIRIEKRNQGDGK